MKNTRFMEVLFSAAENNDEELTNQVANDIEDAKANGVVDTDEVKYEDAGDGRVAITDKETGEVTIAEKANDDDETYDLYPAEITEQVEGFIHPEVDGVTPGAQQGVEDEDATDHLGGMPISECYDEELAEEIAEEGPCCEEEVREFSVSTDNSVVLRIFSDQEFCERIFSEVIESEETAKVGDLKIEKDSEEENAVIVTNETTGDQAKVVLEDDEMEVTELDSKNFSDDEEEVAEDEYDEEVEEEEDYCGDDSQFEPLHVVGVDSFNHQIVDASEYSEESAQELVERLAEQGVEAIQVFECPDEARDYAINLLNSLGVESEEDVEEPEQVEFSDHTVYLTKFYSNTNDFMERMFSESVNDIDATHEAIEDAIENGDEIETDTEIITPIDAKTAVVEDKESGDFTKVTLDGEDMDLDAISEKEAEELTNHIAVDEDEVDEDDNDSEDDEDEKTFSEIDEEIYCDEFETKFFSESEELTNYMIRLFSDEADSAEIEDAIESGEQIENDTEIITPIDATTAVIEDKETGEFTKAVMDDEDLDVTPISEKEAEELTDHVAVEEDNDEEDENDDKEEEEEKEFSMLDKFFADALAPSQPVAPAGQMLFNVDEQGNPISPVEEEAPVETAPAEPVSGAPSVESVEDKAAAAVQSIQAAAAEAEAAILNAKAAPVEGAEEDLKEAQFSENVDFEETICQDDTLMSWLGNK